MERYQDVFSLAPANTIDGLFRDDILPDRNGHELVDYWRDLIPQMIHTDELGGFQLLEIRSSLPDELLMYADKLSMAHSLEVRVPYLDRTVVEVRAAARCRFQGPQCQPEMVASTDLRTLPAVSYPEAKETRVCSKHRR